MKSTIVVVGSLNMDFVVSVDTLPAPGQTVLGFGFQMLPGGKGANQACAAGKLGGSEVLTRMAGRVGYDVFADHLKASLSAAGVDVSAVHSSRSQPTGVALIAVEKFGQNSIVVAPGANHVLEASDVEGLRSTFRGASFALFQLESPLDTVAAALRLAHEEGVRTILDPAPARSLSLEMMGNVDILTPNESEACVLLGQAPGRVTTEGAVLLAEALLALGVGAVLMKLGDRGCFYRDREKEFLSAAFPVAAKDSTAAGDVFNGALAVALAEGRLLPECLRFANAAAAISVTRAGAQASVPTRAEVNEFLAVSAS